MWARSDLARIFRRHSRDTDGLTPSDEDLKLARIGGGDYAAVGGQFLEDFKTFAALTPTDAVLEIGCGIGRIAVPLTTWLRPPGRYEGFDVVRSSVKWCSRHISASYPHFGFKYFDVANTYYNPRGRLRAESLQFPFQEGTFDVVIAVSVFTHLLPRAAANYLAESYRVLRPGGRLFATFFIWRSEDQLESEALKLFPIDKGEFRLGSEDDPEAVVALSMKSLMESMHRLQFRMSHSVFGNWRAGVHILPYQDLIVAAKLPLGESGPP